MKTQISVNSIWYIAWCFVKPVTKIYSHNIFEKISWNHVDLFHKIFFISQKKKKKKSVKPKFSPTSHSVNWFHEIFFKRVSLCIFHNVMHFYICWGIKGWFSFPISVYGHVIDLYFGNATSQKSQYSLISDRRVKVKYLCTRLKLKFYFSISNQKLWRF